MASPLFYLAIAKKAYTGAKKMGLFGESAAKASARQYQYNLKLQQQSQAWQEHVMQNRYQWQRQDLENAGINPLYGMGTAPMGSAGTNSVGMGGDVEEQAQKRQAILQGLQLVTDWSAKRADINLKEKQANTEEYNAMLKQYETIGQELDNLYKQKDLKWYDKIKQKELEKTQSDILNNMSQIRVNNAQSGLIREQTNTARETTNTQRQETINKKEEQYRIRSEAQGNIKNNQILQDKINWRSKHPILRDRAIKRQEYGGSFNSAGNMMIQLLRSLK